MTLSRYIRIAQTTSEFDRLSRRIDDWFQPRLAGKTVAYHPYSTQLLTLKSLLTTSLKALRDEISQLTGSTDRGTVYEQCRLFERRFVWLERVWRFFGDKFDQREDSRYRRVLNAADEIVWSCYAGVFKKAVQPRPTLPLPYIDALYSPSAIPRVDPSELRDPGVGAGFLKDFLRELPIPLVGLPPVCVVAPWWLILVGHEVGHHVQYDLLPDFQLVGHFGRQLQAAAGQPDDAGYDSKVWHAWNREIFADAFSVYNMGDMAVRAMAELEFGSEVSLLTEKRGKASYPPPAVRLKLLATLANQLGLNGDGSLAGWPTDTLFEGAPIMAGPRNLRQIAADHEKRISAVAQTIKSFKFDTIGKSFERLCDFQPEAFQQGGHVRHWVKGLLGQKPLHITPNRALPRLLASSGLAAWIKTFSAENAAEQEAQQQRLCNNLLEKIIASREPGTRSAESTAPLQQGAGLGDRLAQLLLKTPLEMMDNE